MNRGAVMQESTDRRFFGRMESDFSVRLRPEGSKKEHYAVAKNISGAGLKVSTSKRMSLGTNVDLEIFKDGSFSSSKCKGEVVWVSRSRNIEEERAFDAGIKFTKIDFLCLGRMIEGLIREMDSQDLADVII